MSLTDLCRQLKAFIVAGIIDERTAASIIVERYPHMTMEFAERLMQRLMRVLR